MSNAHLPRILLLTAALAGSNTAQQSSAGSSRPQHLAPGIGRVFMAANDGVTGMELWEWSASTGAVQRANAFADTSGIRSSFPDQLTLLGGILGGPLLFAATDATEGRELWSWNGTTATRLAIHPGPADSDPAEITAVQGLGFLTAIASPSGGRRLFRSDAVTAAPVATAAALEDPYGLRAYSTGLLFAATQGGITEPFLLDPSTLIVTPIRPISNLPTYLDPGPFVVNIHGAYFTATVGGARRLVRYEPVNGAQLVSFPSGTDVHPDSLTASPFELAVRARTGSGPQLHLVSGNTARAVTSFTAVEAATISNIAANFAGFWFTARTTSSSEVWFAPTAGLAASPLPPLAASGDAFPRLFRATNSGVRFAGKDGDGLEPWVATSSTVTKLTDLRIGPQASAPGSLATALSSWFAATGANGRELWIDNGVSPIEVDINPTPPAAVDLHIEPKADLATTATVTASLPQGSIGGLIISAGPTTPVSLPGLAGIVRGLLLTLGGAFANLPPPSPTGLVEFDVTFGAFAGPCGAPAVLTAQVLAGVAAPFDLSDPATIVQGCATIGSARIDTFGSFDDKSGEYKIRVTRTVASPPGSGPVHYLALCKRITSSGELILLGSKSISDGETLWLEGEIDLKLPITAGDGPGNRLYLLFVPTPPTQKSIQTYSPTALAWFSYC